MSPRDPRRGPLHLDFSGPRIVLEGLSPEVEARIRSEWRPFVTETGADEPLLTMEVRYAPGAADPAGWDPKAMSASLTPDGAVYRMPEGSAEVSRSGLAQATLVRDLGPREFYTVANLLRACLAWRMPSRGGLMLHAAGLVVDERSFVLVGSEGCGKSTWTTLGERAGGKVISDDVVLVDGAEGRFETLGSALRSTYEGPLTRGRWPLAAVLFPSHGSPPALKPVGELIARARLTANLPFVAAGIERDERIDAVLDRLVEETPRAELRFDLEPSFLSLLREWPA